MTGTQKAGVGLIVGGALAFTAGELIGVTTGGQTVTGWVTASAVGLVLALTGLAVLAFHFLDDYFGDE